MLSVLTIKLGCLRLTHMDKQAFVQTHTEMTIKVTESRSLRAFTKTQFDSLKRRKIVLPVTLYQL